MKNVSFKKDNFHQPRFRYAPEKAMEWRAQPLCSSAPVVGVGSRDTQSTRRTQPQQRTTPVNARDDNEGMRTLVGS